MSKREVSDYVPDVRERLAIDTINRAFEANDNAWTSDHELQ